MYISIVGVDRFPRGYFKAKLEAERVVAESGLPWTTLRATQFYELIAKGATRLAKLPLIPVPAGFVVQPVDSGEVAARLADLALRRAVRPGTRHGRPADPQLRRPDPHLPAGDRAAAAAGGAGLDAGHRPVRAGALYPPPGAQATLGQRTWPDFLTVKQSSLRVI